MYLGNLAPVQNSLEASVRHSLLALTALCGALTLTDLGSAQGPTSAHGGQFVVANRGSGDITLHDAWTGERLRSVPLPAGAAPPEPMYVVHADDEVLVGDRANDRVVRFARATYAVLGTIGVGDGVFHMWANAHQLWVNNDVDKTASVIDLATHALVHTVPMPADLVRDGYRPHDVYVGDRFTYVSLLGGSGASDWVVQYDQQRFTELRRAAVGKDPHLWWDAWSNALYVTAQNGNEVIVLHGQSLRRLEATAQPGAHGVYIPAWTRTLLVTNFAGMGVNDLTASRIGPLGLRAGDTISTNVPTAHNIAALPLGLRIAVTHSGPTARRVTLYRLHGSLLWFGQPRLERLGEVNAGVNPFGIAWVR
jgi:hypothetical protein